MAGREKSTSIVKKLRQNEERYRELFDSINVCVAVFKVKDNGADFVIKDFNSAAEKTEKVSRQDITGKSIIESFPDIGESGLPEVMHRVWETDVPERFTSKFFKGKKIKGWRDNYIYKLPSGDIVNVYEDITERIKGQEALEEAERRYRTVADFTYDWEFWQSPGGKMLYVSPACERISGYPPGHFLKDPHLTDKIILPEDKEIYAAHLDRIKDHIEDSVIYRIKRKNGDIRWIERICRPIFDDQGIYLGIRGSNRDITKRKQTEAKLGESEEKYKLLFDTANEGIAVAQDGRVKFFNPTFAEILGYSKEEIQSKYLSEYLFSEDRDNVLNSYLKSLQGENTGGVLPFRIVNKSGETRWLEIRYILIDWEGKPATLNFINDISKRKLAEEAMRTSEEKYRLVVDNANEGIAIIQDGMVKFANRNSAQTLGMVFDNVIDKPFIEFIHPDDRPMVMDRYDRRLKGEKQEDTNQFRLISKGQSLWVEAQMATIQWEGKPATLVFLTNVSVRKEAEEARRKSEEMYRLLADHTTDTVWLMDMDLKTTYHSPSISTIRGFTAEEIMEMTLEQNLTPPSLKLASEVFLLELPRIEVDPGYNPVITLDLEYYCKDGTTKWAENKFSIIRGPGGKPVSILGEARDITERIQVEDSLRKSEEKYRTILDKMEEGYFEVNLKGKLTFFNDALADLIGYSREELQEMDYRQYIPADHQSIYVETFARVFSTGIPSELHHYPRIRKDGSTIYANLFIVPIKNVKGEVTGIRGIVRDITAQEKADEELQLRAELLGLANDSIYVMDIEGNFIYANEAFYKSRGYTLEESKSFNIHDLVGPGYTANIDTRIQEVIRNKELVFESEHLSKNGSGIPVEIRSRAIIYKGQTCLLSTARDISERKKAEEALQKSEERYRTILDQMDEAYYEADLKGNMTFFNDALTRLFGYTREEMMGMNGSEYIPAAQRADYIEAFKQIFKTGKPLELYSQPRIRKDGSTIYLDVSVFPIKSPGGEVIGFRGVARDVTAKLKAAEELRTSEERYRSILDQMGEAYYEMDLQGNLTFFNEALTRLMGYTSDEMMGMNYRKYVPADRQTAHLEAVQQISRTGMPVELFNEPRIRKDGSIIYVDVPVIPIKNAEGEITGFRGISSNITDKLKSEEALQTSEEKFRMLAENSADVIWTLDKKLNLTYISPAVVKILGITPEEALGLDMAGSMTPASMQKLTDTVRHFSPEIEQGTDRVVQVEIEHIRKGGGTVWVELAIRALYDKTGKHTGFIGITHDISERKKAEEALRINEEKFRMLAENSADAIWTLDTDLNLTYMSPAIKKILGVSQEEAYQYSILDSMTPDSLRKITEALEQYRPEIALGTDKIIQLEIEHIRKDGSTVWAELSVRALYNTDKKFTGFIGVTRDVSERKKAEEALRQSEEKYRLLADNSLDCIWTADPDSKLTYVSPSVKRIRGITAEEAMQESLADSMTPESQVRFIEELQRIGPDIEQGKDVVSIIEIEQYHKNGGTVWVEMVIRTLHDQAGRFTGSIGASREIGKRKAAEAALRQSEEKYRLLADNSLDCIWTLDTNLNLTYVSPSIIKLRGITPEEAFRETIAESMTPQSQALIWKVMEKNRQEYQAGTDKNVRLEIEHYHKNGSTVWVEMVLSTLYDETGRLSGFIGASRDISERRKSQEAIRRSEEKYRMLAENTEDVIWTCDTNFHFTYMSPSIFKLRGFTVEEAILQQSDQIATPESSQRLFHAVELASGDIKKGLETSLTIEAEQYCKDGSPIWTESLIRPLYDSSRKHTGYIGVTRDISSRKRAEQSSKESNVKFSAAFMLASDPTAITDVDTGVFIEANPAWSKWTGYTAEELINHSSLDVNIWDVPEQRAEILEILRRQEEVKDREIRVRTKSGQVRDAMFSGRIMTINNREYLFSRIRDITEQKQAQEALRKSEEKYRMLAENTEDVIWTSGTDLYLTYVSPSIFKLRGFTPEEVMLHKLDQLATPQSIQVLMHKMKLAADDFKNGRETTVTAEAEQYCKDGSTKWTESIIQPLYDNNRKHTGYIGVTRDISSRKQAEQHLRESESKFTAAFMLSSDPTAITEIESGKFIEANPAWTRWTGYTPDELVSKSSVELNIWYDPWQRDQILEKIRIQGEIEDLEVRIQTKPGQVREALYSGRIMKIGDRQYLFSRIHDITEIKRAEKELHRSEEKYRLLTENAYDCIWTMDTDLKPTYVSPAIRRLRGFEPDEAMLQTIEDQCTPESTRVTQREMRRAWADAKNGINGTYSVIAEQYHKNGSTVWVESIIRTFTDTAGKFAGFIGVSRDVTERVAASKALEQINRQLADIINFLPDATMAADKNKNIIIWNRAIEQLTGVAASDMVGKGDYLYSVPFYGEERPVLMDLIWEDRQDIRDRYPYIIQDGDSLISEAFCPALYGGKGAWVFAKASPLHDRDGNIVGAIEAVRDITARKQAEEDIKKSEEKYRLLAENADDCIWTMDSKLRATYVSPAIRKLRGFEPEEAILQTGKDQNTPESYRTLQQEMLRALKDIKNGIRDTYRVVSEQYHKNGTTVWVESIIRPYYDNDGAFAGFIGVSRDVTERMKAEEKIRQSEEQYRLLAENAEDCIWTLDIELNYTYISPSIRKLNRYEPDEMKRLPVKELVTPRSMPVIMKDLITLRKNAELGINETMRSETEQYRKDGSTVWIESTLRPYNDDSGRLAGFIGISRDVTERRAINEALRESEAKYSNVVENVGEALLVLQDGLVKFFNKSYTDLLESPASELLDKSFMPYIHPDDKELVAGTYKARMEGKPVPEYYSFRVVTRTNQVRWVEVRGSLITWEGRLASLNFVLDITERKLAEQALKESEERYRLLAENTEDVIWTVDANFIYTYVSPSIFKLRGLKPEEIVGQTLTSTLTPQSIQLLNEQWEARSKAAQDGTPMTWRGEIQAPRKDGSMVWTEAVLKTLHDDTGKYIGFIGVSRDISVRKAADEALKESEAKYSSLLENAAEAILVAQDGLVKFLNKRLTEVVGYQASEMLETPFTRYIHPDDVDTVVGNYSARMRGEAAPDVYVFRIVTRDNQVRWAEIHVTMINWEGRPASLNFLIDITARKLAEKALQESDERYRLIAENTDDVIWSVDTSLNLKYFSPSIRKLLGYEPDEILKKSLTELMVPESLQAVMHELEINRADIEAGIEKSVMMEVQQYHKDGHTVWIEINVKTFFDNDRKFVGFTGTSRDITARKAAERSIRESEEKFRNIFEQSKDAILITDKDGSILDVNDAMCVLTGYSRDEILFSDLKPVQDGRKAFRNLIKKTGSVRDQELALHRKDGTLINVLVSASVREDKAGNILGYQGILHDMTERRRLEEERQKTARLESIGTLAGGIAHDFNNILGAIIGNISLAKSDLDAGHSSYDLLQDAEKAIMRARDLTGQLLTFARGGAPIKKLINLKNTIKDTASFAVRGSSVKCQLTFDDGLLPVNVDEGQISQVIHNLVLNARQAMPSGGEVEINAENITLDEEKRLGRLLSLAPGKYIRITVHDHGIGIQPEHLDKIFDPYFTTKHDGSGLGLATCYSIVKNHGGMISAESIPGKGSTFYVYLPASPGKTIAAVKEDRKETARMNGRILIMDDEESLRRTMTSMLKRLGFEQIEAAADGEEALKMYRKAMQAKQPFDAVILDLTVPGGMGGKETMENLLEIDPSVTAIVSSGYANEAIMADYTNYGFKGVIVKPYTFDELKHTVSDIMNGLKPR